MAKFDVESAYRYVPVHPSDHYLLEMKWRNQHYIDLAPPFGCVVLVAFLIQLLTW